MNSCEKSHIFKRGNRAIEFEFKIRTPILQKFAKKADGN